MMKRRNIKLAVVEDDLFYNKSLLKYLKTICDPKIYSKTDFSFQSFTNADDAIQQLENDLNYMLLDYHLFNPEAQQVLTGMDVLKEVREYCPECHVIVMSGESNPAITAALYQEGILEFVDKNMNTKNRIGAIIQKSLDHELRA